MEGGEEEDLKRRKYMKARTPQKLVKTEKKMMMTRKLGC